MYKACIIVWRRPTLPRFIAVPSALVGLTSLFGMGRGGPHRQNHHKVFTARAEYFRRYCNNSIINLEKEKEKGAKKAKG